MILSPEVISFIQSIGLPAFIVLSALWFTYTKIIPRILDKWDTANTERVRLDEEHRQERLKREADYRDELHALRKEAVTDKMLMLDAFNRNTAALIEIQRTQNMFIAEMKEISKQVQRVDNDVKMMYIITGQSKKLLEDQILDKELGKG